VKNQPPRGVENVHKLSAFGVEQAMQAGIAIGRVYLDPDPSVGERNCSRRSIIGPRWGRRCYEQKPEQRQYD